MTAFSLEATFLACSVLDLAHASTFLYPPHPISLAILAPTRDDAQSTGGTCRLLGE
jgi:hypothetical protein